MKAEKAGQYTFSAYLNDGGRLWVDGKLLIDKWAKCNDGTYSYAERHQGACSNHGGVAEFYK